jgi:hypothetical protein
VSILTKRESISLTGDPPALGQWHHLDWWYAPEGSVLAVDGVMHDSSTDGCVPDTVEVGEAFYLGDQPSWDPGSRKGVFYPPNGKPRFSSSPPSCWGVIHHAHRVGARFIAPEARNRGPLSSRSIPCYRINGAHAAVTSSSL